MATIWTEFIQKRILEQIQDMKWVVIIADDLVVFD